jgi:hypothetical protein
MHPQAGKSTPKSCHQWPQVLRPYFHPPLHFGITPNSDHSATHPHIPPARSKLHVWDWKGHQLRQSIDLGADGAIPLEIRFAHEPSATWGYVVSCCAAWG